MPISGGLAQGKFRSYLNSVKIIAFDAIKVSMTDKIVFFGELPEKCFSHLAREVM